MNVVARVFFLVIGMSLAGVVAAEDVAAGTRESLPVSSATAQQDADAVSQATTEARAEPGGRATLTPDDDAAQAKPPEKTVARASSAQSDSLLLLLLQLLRSPK